MFDPSGDLEVMDGLEPVTYVAVGSSTVSAGGVVTRPTTETAVQALRRQISKREVSASRGRYREGDAVWQVLVAAIASEPTLDDSIKDADEERWNVLSYDKATLGTRWRLVTRR